MFSKNPSNDPLLEDAAEAPTAPSHAPKAIAVVLVVGLAGAVAVHMWRSSARDHSTAEASDVAAEPTDAAAQPRESESPTIEFDPPASLERADATKPKSSYAEARRKAAAASLAKKLRVESVTVIGKNTSCVINGQRLSTGEMVDGFRVERFTRGAVVVAKDGFLFELRPPETVQRSDPPRDSGGFDRSAAAARVPADAGPGGTSRQPGPTVWAPAEPPKRPKELDEVDRENDSKWDSMWDSKWGSQTRTGRAARSSKPAKAR